MLERWFSVVAKSVARHRRAQGARRFLFLGPWALLCLATLFAITKNHLSNMVNVQFDYSKSKISSRYTKSSFGSPNLDAGRESYAFWNAAKRAGLKWAHWVVGRPWPDSNPYQTCSKGSLHVIWTREGHWAHMSGRSTWPTTREQGNTTHDT